MFSRTYPLTSNGQTGKLRVSWGLFWRNLTVRLDGRTVGRISGGLSQLRRGVDILLPDSTSLRIQAITHAGEGVGLAVLHDGIPLPGSPTPPAPSPGHSNAASIPRFAGILIFGLLIPMALLLWLGVWLTGVAKGLSDTVRCLLSVGIFFAFMAGLPMFVAWRTAKPRSIRQWLSVLGKVLTGERVDKAD